MPFALAVGQCEVTFINYDKLLRPNGSVGLALKNYHDTEMKTWIRGVRAIMQAIECSLGYYHINLFHATGIFLYLPKTSENS